MVKNARNVKNKRIGHIIRSRYDKGQIVFDAEIYPPKEEDINPSSRYDGREKKKEFNGAIVFGSSPLVPQITYEDIIEAVKEYQKWLNKKQDEYVLSQLQPSS